MPPAARQSGWAYPPQPLAGTDHAKTSDHQRPRRRLGDAANRRQRHVVDAERSAETAIVERESDAAGDRGEIEHRREEIDLALAIWAFNGGGEEFVGEDRTVPGSAVAGSDAETGVAGAVEVGEINRQSIFFARLEAGDGLRFDRVEAAPVNAVQAEILLSERRRAIGPTLQVLDIAVDQIFMRGAADAVAGQPGMPVRVISVRLLGAMTGFSKPPLTMTGIAVAGAAAERAMPSPMAKAGMLSEKC